MAEIMRFLGENEFLIVVGLLCALFILIMVIILIDLSHRKDRDKPIFPLQKPEDEYGIQTFEEEIDDENVYLDEEIPLIEETPLGMIADNTILDQIDVGNVTRSLEKTSEIEEIKYVEEDEELEKTKARIELQTLKEELAKIEKSDFLEESDIIDGDLKNTKEQPTLIPTPIIETEDPTQQFEDEQEENAIISVEELTKKSMEISDEEIERYEDDGNEPISIAELEALYKESEEVVIPVEESKKMELTNFDMKPTNEEEPKKFRNTPFISPVYGLKTEENKTDIILEQTAELDEVNEELKRTNEFLMMLQELRKNL